MIDFAEEFKKYDFFQVEDDEVAIIKDDYLLNINKNMRRIGKDQNNLAILMEDMNESVNDVFESLDKLKSLNDLANEFLDEKERFNEENRFIIKNVIEILDTVESLVYFSNSNLQNSYQVQIKLIWDQIENIIEKISLKRIDDNGKKFSNELNIAKKVVTIEEKENNIIVETINSGYLYKGEVFRKSQVVVNKKEVDLIG